MVDNQTRVNRWRGIAAGVSVPGARPYGGDSNIIVEGDRIYSYGHHFEMARAVRDNRGKFLHFLVNGDVASVSTTRHQGYVRWAIRNEESVIIPFSALESAGIELDSIKILEVTTDRWTPGLRRVAEKPWWWEDVAQDGAQRYNAKTNLREVPTAAGKVMYEWMEEQRHHHLGESLIRAKVTWRDFIQDDTGRAIETVTRSRWATFLSGFDMAESRPLYFLAELPYRSKAKTVAEAYEALKPEPVVLAEGLGREVQRQGDIFAVPVPSMDTRKLRKMGARIEKRVVPHSVVTTEVARVHLPYILKTNHTATEVAYLPGGLTLVRGTMYHDPQGRQPDHARHTLGKQWHVVVKNTVPTTRRRAA